MKMYNNDKAISIIEAIFNTDTRYFKVDSCLNITENLDIRHYDDNIRITVTDAKLLALIKVVYKTIIREAEGTKVFMNYGRFIKKSNKLMREIATQDVPRTTRRNNLDHNNEFTDLTNNPILEGLLMNYITATYQFDADLSSESVWAEYNLLKRENRLNDLFIQENLDNTNDLSL